MVDTLVFDTQVSFGFSRSLLLEYDTSHLVFGFAPKVTNRSCGNAGRLVPLEADCSFKRAFRTTPAFFKNSKVTFEYIAPQKVFESASSQVYKGLLERYGECA